MIFRLKSPMYLSSLAFKDKAWQLASLQDLNHRLLWNCSLCYLNSVLSNICNKHHWHNIMLRWNTGCGTCIWLLVPFLIILVDISVYWLYKCDTSRTQFGSRIVTKKKHITMGHIQMNSYASSAELDPFCSAATRSKPWRPGRRPMVAASLFVFWSSSCRRGSAGRPHRAGHTTGHSE